MKSHLSLLFLTFICIILLSLGLNMITAGEQTVLGTEFSGNIKLLETFFKIDGAIFALSARIQFPTKIH